MIAQLFHERLKANDAMPCDINGGESAQKSCDLAQLSG
jgi:hypothetical protein